jgi:hypothetical protein
MRIQSLLYTQGIEALVNNVVSDRRFIDSLQIEPGTSH